MRRYIIALLVAFFALVQREARAVVPLCLEVRSDASNAAGFEKLVRSELGRHRSHVVAVSDCESRLFVESFQVGGTRFLTARVDGEIPVRHRVSSDAELEHKLSDALSRALGSDPASLARSPGELSASERALRSVLVRGNNSYRLALFETLARTDRGVAFAPGLAFELTRGADHFQVYARAELGGSLGSVRGPDRALRALAGVGAGVMYEASRRAATSGYAALGASATFLRFEGRLDPADASSLEHVETVGATLQGRLGVRFFRLYDFDFDAFALGALPLFATKSADSLLFGEDGAYTPYAQLGLGVGF